MASLFTLLIVIQSTQIVYSQVEDIFKTSKFSSSSSNNSINPNVVGSKSFTNSTLQPHTEQQELHSVIAKLKTEISPIMQIAERSMNGTNSFGNLPLVNLTAELMQQYNGIPQDQDSEKRNEAKRLLANNPALLYIGLLLPNGDRYFGEPFIPYQANGSVSNFAFRDHFTGALESNSSYLSNTLIAVSTGEPLSILASPIYSHETETRTLVGVLVMGINHKYLDELIDSAVSLTKNDTRIVLVDNNGTKIGDSSSDENSMESFSSLQSFKNAKNGESGAIIEKIAGRESTISYSPLDFAQTKWIVLSISPIK
jgi:hypothetical protein